MTQSAVTIDPAALAASVTEWWALAGVDVAVQDMPRDWLARARSTTAVQAAPAQVFVPVTAPVVAATPAVPVVAPPDIASSMPDALEPFLAWLANDPSQPETGFSATRVLPQVPTAPDLLIVTDMPTQDDMASGALFSSADATLLGGMLRAIGVERDRTALASLLLARPTGGIVDERIEGQATMRLHHFLRLLRPGAVILLGDRTNRAFAKTNGELDSLPTRTINLDDGTVTVLSLPAPFVLLKHPERKAAAWGQLRQLARR